MKNRTELDELLVEEMTDVVTPLEEDEEGTVIDPPPRGEAEATVTNHVYLRRIKSEFGDIVYMTNYRPDIEQGATVCYNRRYWRDVSGVDIPMADNIRRGKCPEGEAAES